MSAFPRILFCLAAVMVTVDSSSTLAQSSSNGIAAVVNGRVITKSEVRDAVNAQEQMLMVQLHNDPAALQREVANMRATALDSLIDRELILSEFKRMGASMKPQWVDDDINQIVRDSFKGNREAFVKELAKTGMTMKKFRELREKMLIIQAMRQKQASMPTPAAPKDVDAFYQKNLDKWRSGGMIKISTITIPKYSGDDKATPASQRKLAEEIRSKVLKGADFAAMAKEHSKDSAAENGGARDWMPREQLNPVIANVAFGLKTGGISSILDDGGSYLIISCDAVKYGAAKPLTEVRPDIERVIANEKAKKIIDKWMADLRKKATIKKYGW
jgi:parvulin-like peptidyl-prolyl isomerase